MCLEHLGGTLGRTLGTGTLGTGFDAESPHPLTVSWPYNCGRVVYTTYHTMGTTQGGQHSGLYEQDMILYFLLMEIGVCQDDVPVIE